MTNNQQQENTYLIFGKNGQVGWELNHSLRPLGKIVTLDRDQADFSNLESLRKIVAGIKPDVIVNAVAYTAVDKAEEEEAVAEKVNSIAPGVLAEEALKIGVLLVHYSTDYVFDGRKDAPYLETDTANPVNVYGRTKLAGEQAIQLSGCDYLIFRTSWVYASRGHNFLLTILRLAKEREELSIVADQTGSPTTAKLIAETTATCIQQALQEKLLGTFASGLYHLTTSGYTSWHGFAEEIVRLTTGVDNDQLTVKKIKGIPTADYPTPAERPKNSRLVLSKLQEKFNIEMPSWKNALQTCLKEIN